jgi:hypothetical protein
MQLDGACSHILRRSAIAKLRLVSGRSAVRIRSPALVFRTIILSPCFPRARWLSCLGLLGLGEFGPSGLGYRVGQGALTCSGGVQVDQRGTRAVVAHPRHEFIGVRARVSGELVAGMPQVVTADTGQADRSERGKPDTASEVRVHQRASSRAGEGQRGTIGKRGEVLAQLRHDQVSEDDDPTTGPRLRRAEQGCSSTTGERASYPHGAGLQVDVLGTERGEFAPAEAGEGG